MLLLLVLGMLEVLVVLKELVVFVGGIFGRVKPPNLFLGEIIESKKKNFGTTKDIKIFKTKWKIQLYFRNLHSIIPVQLNLQKIYLNLPEFIWIYLNLPECTWMCYFAQIKWYFGKIQCYCYHCLIVKCGGIFDQNVLQEQFLCTFGRWCMHLNNFAEITRDFVEFFKNLVVNFIHESTNPNELKKILHTGDKESLDRCG